MTDNKPNPKQEQYAHIDVNEVLAERGQIAIPWDIADVQGVRPDLTDDQAFEVLILCKKYHDADMGISYPMIKAIADELLPAFDWNVETVKQKRPDLSEEQATLVLRQCQEKYIPGESDLSLIESAADELFPNAAVK